MALTEKEEDCRKFRDMAHICVHKSRKWSAPACKCHTSCSSMNYRGKYCSVITRPIIIDSKWQWLMGSSEFKKYLHTVAISALSLTTIPCMFFTGELGSQEDLREEHDRGMRCDPHLGCIQQQTGHLWPLPSFSQSAVLCELRKMEKALQLNDLEGQVMEGKRIIKFPRDQQKSHCM